MNRIAAVLFALLLASCGGGGSSSGSGANPPSSPPTYLGGVHYAYYWTDEQQLAETVNHVDTIFIPYSVGSTTRSHMFSFARSNNLSVIIEIEQLVYDGEHYLGNVTSVKLYLDDIRSQGFLDLIIGVYPADEPDLHYSATDVTKANTELRDLFSKYQRFNPRLLVVYSDNSPVGIETYDWVGRDRYPAIQPIDNLSPTQCQILINGGADPWRDLPDEAVAYAKENGNVCLYMPFLWRNWLKADGTVGGIGIRSNGLASAYCKAGQALTLKHGGC